MFSWAHLLALKKGWMKTGNKQFSLRFWTCACAKKSRFGDEILRDTLVVCPNSTTGNNMADLFYIRSKPQQSINKLHCR